jgi:predicted dehydrogenase
MAKKKGAVIGIGGIGKMHGQLMNDTGRIEVVAVCDANEETREIAQERFPEATFYTDHKQMLEKESLDLVSVVVPHNLHAPFTIDCLEAGANVVVEKPMATTFEDCQRMIEAATKADRFVTVFHNRRLDGWFLSARTAVREGLLGNLIVLRSGIKFGPGPQTWRGYKEKSGGLLFDWGCHLVDYLIQIADSPISQVSGHFYRGPEHDVELNEQFVNARIYFENGALGEVTLSGLDEHNPFRYHFVGEEGTLIDKWQWGGEEGQNALQVHHRLAGGERTVSTIQYHKNNPQKYYDNVADAVCGGQPLLVSPQSAAEVINVLTTAERSWQEGGKPLPLAT